MVASTLFSRRLTSALDGDLASRIFFASVREFLLDFLDLGFERYLVNPGLVFVHRHVGGRKLLPVFQVQVLKDTL